MGKHCGRIAGRMLVAGFLGGLAVTEAAAQPSLEPGRATADEVLVEVNGEPVTSGDLRFLMVSRGVSEKLRPRVRERFLQRLIERRLIRDFLARRKTQADPIQIDEQVNRIKRMIRRNGDDPQKVLAQFAYTEEKLREELSLPLAWTNYVRQITTPEKLRAYFREHRDEFDGTQVQARQIFLKTESDAGRRAAREKLRKLRTRIENGEVAFAEAAREHSEAPSRKQGGELGFFPYRGKMPAAITRVAFKLEVNEISEPFHTQFGTHLVQVTDRKPGRLSLEDVRSRVFQRLSRELWNEKVAEIRKQAEIERK